DIDFAEHQIGVCLQLCPDRIARDSTQIAANAAQRLDRLRRPPCSREKACLSSEGGDRVERIASGGGEPSRFGLEEQGRGGGFPPAQISRSGEHVVALGRRVWKARRGPKGLIEWLPRRSDAPDARRKPCGVGSRAKFHRITQTAAFANRIAVRNHGSIAVGAKVLNEADGSRREGTD